MKQSILLAVVLTAACRTWQLEPIPAQTLLERRHPAELRITRVDSSTIVLGRPKLQGDTLVGMGPTGVTVHIPFDSVYQTARHRFRMKETATNVLWVGVFVGLFSLMKT